MFYVTTYKYKIQSFKCYYFQVIHHHDKSQYMIVYKKSSTSYRIDQFKKEIALIENIGKL